MTGTINPHSANERKCGRLGCHSDMSVGDLIGRLFSVDIYNILIFRLSEVIHDLWNDLLHIVADLDSNFFHDLYIPLIVYAIPPGCSTTSVARNRHQDAKIIAGTNEYPWCSVVILVFFCIYLFIILMSGPVVFWQLATFQTLYLLSVIAAIFVAIRFRMQTGAKTPVGSAVIAAVLSVFGFICILLS